jgi:hypothetical protein
MLAWITLVVLLSQTAALPLLPLAKNAESDDGGLRTFIVQVQEPQRKLEEVKQPEQQQQREFPWPYPPVFESALPLEAKQHLIRIYFDQSVTSEDRANQVNAIFDSLSQQVIEQLPLPAEYERLPADVYRRLLYIHVAPGFKWAERQQLIRDIVESLPEEQKALMRTPRIGGPPPGFETVLAPTVYKQLLLVHHNPRISKEEKSELITRIMRQVPQEQINQLPLPAGMESLPVELRIKARSLVYDYTVPQPIRAQKVREFVQGLSAEIRPQL